MDIICFVKNIEPFEAMKVSIITNIEPLHKKSFLLPKFPKKEPKHSHKTKLRASAKVCSKEPNHYTIKFVYAKVLEVVKLNLAYLRCLTL